VVALAFEHGQREMTMAKALGGNVSFGFESGRARSVCKAVSSGAHGPGRKILVHGNPVKTHESGTMLPVVVIEFDSVEQPAAAHDSERYQAALKALGDGAVRDIRIVEGVA